MKEIKISGDDELLEMIEKIKKKTGLSSDQTVVRMAIDAYVTDVWETREQKRGSDMLHETPATREDVLNYQTNTNDYEYPKFQSLRSKPSTDDWSWDTIGKSAFPSEPFDIIQQRNYRQRGMMVRGTVDMMMGKILPVLFVVDNLRRIVINDVKECFY